MATNFRLLIVGLARVGIVENHADFAGRNAEARTQQIDDQSFRVTVTENGKEPVYFDVTVQESKP